MAVIGIVAGVVLVVAPQTGDFIIKPYFWVLLAVGAFDLFLYLYKRTVPEMILGMDARLLGFVIGVVAMVVIPSISGSPAKFF